ncbi:pantothenate kinase [Phormidium sp. CLA17]|uniref:pantothenate kinase n=1 Tax=Leptolyngbya sp. Cla-17 TaxID=2803751 RepID=UPI001491B803|nr:pantothenate kinase [Leptolyngbya sp. Cla-17]MBM0740760.1 pantothenate kinase [Leptolyngbya sp. Cla-17]
MTNVWIALVIGNSRLHWAEFSSDRLQKTWDTPHVNQDQVQLLHELWIASVVPSQNQFWQAYDRAHFLSLEQVPLQGMYPTLGIDRALAVWGAIQTVGDPVLVIDAGTALTLTGSNGDRLIGGAILPGLKLQFQSLNQGTAALPLFSLPLSASSLPHRWALTTETAIASGILHTVIAGLHSFIHDWRQIYPTSAVVFTGGDGNLLHHYFQDLYPNLASSVKVNPHLAFNGIRAIRKNNELFISN